MAADLFPKGVPKDLAVPSTSSVTTESWTTSLSRWLDSILASAGFGPQVAVWSGDEAVRLQSLDGEEYESGVIPVGTYSVLWKGKPMMRVDAAAGEAYTLKRESDGRVYWREAKNRAVSTYGSNEDVWNTVQDAEEMTEKIVRGIWDVFEVDANASISATARREWTVEIEVSTKTPKSILGGIASMIAQRAAPMLVPYTIVEPARVIFVLERRPKTGWRAGSRLERTKPVSE